VAEPMLTDRQLAAETGYSVKTLYRWRRAGTGPRWVTCGSRGIRYRRGDVDRWLEQRSAGPRPRRR
jgi:predicted DNA-binding transcriptional regulator AlpA